MRERVRIVFGLGRQFGEGDIAGRVDEFAELAIGDGRPVHPEPIHGNAVDGRFLRIVPV